MSTKAFQDLKTIFNAGLKKVDPFGMIIQQVSLDGDILSITARGGKSSYDLNKYSRIFVLGAGKATAKMALGIEEVLGSRITEGCISVKYGHTEDLKQIRMIEAGHPVPDENSRLGAEEIVKLAEKGDDKTLYIILISGGGSALLSLPGSGGLTLEDKQETTKLLLSCGASIQEINGIRKHLSGIKGGRFAQYCPQSDVITLILSDVIGDRLDTIASGLTVPDETTFSDALTILEKYKLKEKVPEKVLEHITRGNSGGIPETPEKDDPVFVHVENILIGTNLGALSAAEAEAKALGYNTAVLSSQITGEAREIAKFYYGIGRDIKDRELFLKKPACVLAGGETTVTLLGSGKGGRNQEMALAFLLSIQEDPEGSEGIYFLSGATDGNDGPTDAAGGFACTEILSLGRKSGMDPLKYLQASDSYSYLSACEGLFVTGPTNTNVCDLQIMLVL